MTATIPFRPAPPARAARRHKGEPITVRFPSPDGPLTVNAFAHADFTLISRSWTEEGARACALCERGCRAYSQYKPGVYSCMVFGPPGLTDEEARDFRCEHPDQFEGRTAAPPPPVFAKPARERI